CRDVTRALELAYPIFSRGRYMRTGKDRVEVESQGAAISLGEIQVRPGDILVGDADGILVVPRVRESEVFDTAREIEDAEQAIERETAKGTRLDEARRVFRYHQLQTHGNSALLSESLLESAFERSEGLVYRALEPSQHVCHVE